MQNALYNNLERNFLPIWIFIDFVDELQITDPERIFHIIKQRLNYNHALFSQFIYDILDFYNNYPGFQYFFDSCPASVISGSFFQNIDINNLKFDTKENNNTIVILKYIDKVLEKRFFQIVEIIDKKLRLSLAILVKDPIPEISTLAEKIRFKIYNYNGVLPPDELIFISLLNRNQADKLTEYTIGISFESSTNKISLSSLFSVCP